MKIHSGTALVLAAGMLFSLTADGARRRNSRRPPTRSSVRHWGPKNVEGPRLLVRMGAFSGKGRLAQALSTGQQVVVRAKLTVDMDHRVGNKVAEKVARVVRETAHQQEAKALEHRARRKEDRAAAVKKPLLVFDLGLSRKAGGDPSHVNLAMLIGTAVRAGADAIRVPPSVSRAWVLRTLARLGAAGRVSQVSSLRQLMGSLDAD